MSLPGLRDMAPFWPQRLADLWGDRPAFTDPDTPIAYSYADLRDRALRAAASLAAHGVGQGDRVASLTMNGVVPVDLLFACGRLGAIFVPLNWRLSERELGHVLTDTEPCLLVVEEEFLQRAEAIANGIPILPVEHLSRPVNGEPPDARVRLDDAWLILYTGGTTGLPKGAILTHGSILWNAINTTVSWGLSPNDVAPSFTPMFHTGGFNVFTLPLLLLGGRVIVPRTFDPSQAVRILVEERPTIVFMVPTMFAMVAEQPDFAQANLSSIRWAISGGAPLPERVYRQWKPQVPIFKQGYGLTEVGPNNFATSDEEALQRGYGSVGRLTAFASARIVDTAGRDVPDGTPGELLLAGPHMCAGYWRRPEATAEAIRHGWFHTGDIARRDPDGFYFIVDRKKDMIISGGENVYPTEVEAVLYEHPAVREAAVVGVPDVTWGEAVTAVVSFKDGQSLDVEVLRVFVSERLARYKCPKRIHLVDDLPKSAAGKILRTEARKLVAESG